MNIDCTLNALKVPGFSGFDTPFGSQKPQGQSLTGREAADNALLPFGLQRPKVVSENSTTTQIQVNTVFEFVTGGITLTLGVASFTGCRVALINSASTNVTAIFGATSFLIEAKSSIHLEFVGNAWVAVDDYSDITGLLIVAIDYAGMANRETQKTVNQRIQSGVALIKNRGIISGCTVTKGTTAIRNISLATGSFFMNGMEMPCPAFNNAALVPANYSETAQYCYAYIYLQNNTVVFACTPLGGTVPDDALGLFRLTVPGGNTDASDPHLANVTITDVRRIEAGYPMQFNSIAYASVALPFNMLNSEYHVSVDIMSFKGGATQRLLVYPGDKAANGFKIYADGTLDMVQIRWMATKNIL